MAVVELGTDGRPRVVEDDADGNTVDLRTTEFAPLGVVPQRATSQPARQLPRAPSEPISAAKLMRDIRARLKVVRQEIRLRKSLEREERQLERLLKAAKEQPTTVRTIRAAG